MLPPKVKIKAKSWETEFVNGIFLEKKKNPSL
jgi:hypothetical protein